jgi:hypothetical protein
MKKSSSSALGLTVAIALSAGGVLTEHPLYTDPAPGAYSDITIAEADNQKTPSQAGGEPAIAPDKPQLSTSKGDKTPGPKTEEALGGQGEQNKGTTRPNP